VTGSASDIVGVWIDPVIAQLMMILFAIGVSLPLRFYFGAYRTVRIAATSLPGGRGAHAARRGGRPLPERAVISRLSCSGHHFRVMSASQSTASIVETPLAGTGAY
jgi:hypothetical protein